MNLPSWSRNVPSAHERLVETGLKTALSYKYGQRSDDITMAQREAVIAKLLSFDPEDIKWHLSFIESHSELGVYLLETIEYLSPEQYTLHLNRLDYAWENLSTAVNVHRAWDALMSYPDQEPGYTEKESSAVFTVIAYMLNKNLDHYLEEKTYLTYNESCGSAHWFGSELSPELFTVVKSNADRLHLIINLIKEHMVDNPMLINYILNDEPPSSDKMDQRAFSIISKIHRLRRPAGANFVVTQVKNSRYRDAMSAREAFNRKVSDFIYEVDEARLNDNRDLMDVYERHVKACTKDTMIDTFVALFKIVSILKDTTKKLSPVVDSTMVSNMIKFNAALTEDYYVNRNPQLNERTRSGMTRFEETLHSVVIYGSPEVVRFLIEDFSGAITVLSERNLTSFPEVLETLEGITVSTSIGSGYL